MNRRLIDGDLQLRFEPTNGYLKSVLEALHVPVESQMLVYSETSLQFEHITQAAPRALYFNDSVAVGWVKGAATRDQKAGAVPASDRGNLARIDGVGTQRSHRRCSHPAIGE